MKVFAMLLALSRAGALVPSRQSLHHGARRATSKTFVAAEGGRGSAAVSQAKETKERGGKVEKLDLAPPRGTRDFYPEDMRLQSWLFGEWREVARLFGFSEYDAPVLENEALYTRKAGEEVTQQLYNFEDKGERRVALRPEMTPSLARMVLAKKAALPLPLKWFSIPQCWRYERMTRGRRREHYQWNMDVWGVPGPEAEAELLAAAVAFFERVGLTSEDVGIKVNSRAVLQVVMTELGVGPEAFAPACVLVDKLEKVPLDAILGDFEAIGVTKETVEALVQVLESPNLEALKLKLEELATQNDTGGGEGRAGGDAKATDALADLEALFGYAEAGGFADWLVFDASVVRGLSYYTGVVFEAIKNLLE
mmetsp:Transcript_41332/g.93112  ORF Transcript_41332/g.93112 Transcript_41332/m.93112 type:complete len:366 (-) Transcript_41332:148-1245(-)